MRFKYFIRGLGFGILFSCIIMLATYQGKPTEKLSDAEIVERAKELGMVEAEDGIEQMLKENSENNKATEKIKEDDDTRKSESATEQVTEATSETVASTETEQTTIDQKTDVQQQVEIIVERGSSSYPVCEKLKAAGMIDDAEKFDNYLIANGYADRIRVGTHVLTKGMDYEAIAKAIIDPE